MSYRKENENYNLTYDNMVMGYYDINNLELK